jgi:hypothetical protein
MLAKFTAPTDSEHLRCTRTCLHLNLSTGPAPISRSRSPTQQMTRSIMALTRAWWTWQVVALVDINCGVSDMSYGGRRIAASWPWFMQGPAFRWALVLKTCYIWTDEDLGACRSLETNQASTILPRNIGMLAAVKLSYYIMIDKIGLWIESLKKYGRSATCD